MTKGKQAPNGRKGLTVLWGGTIDCYINSSQAFKGAEKICSFTDTCHLEIADGQYLIIKASEEGWASNDIIEIELTEYE